MLVAAELFFTVLSHFVWVDAGNNNIIYNDEIRMSNDEITPALRAA